LVLHEHRVNVIGPVTGGLFLMEAQTLSERRTARRASINERVAACAEICNAEPDEKWVVWCELNDEGNMLTEAIDGAVQISGADSTEVKEQRLQDFAAGKIRVLVSKCSIAGFGLNWAFASRMAFVGVTDSFEAYYQAVRRQWRFGQKRSVQVHIFSSAAEGAVVENLKRKESDAIEMANSLSAETRDALKESVVGLTRQSNPYLPKIGVKLPAWLTN
jgi:superfamily II DNA or RNA helicase